MLEHRDIESRLETAHQLAERVSRRKADLVEAAAKDAGFPAKITSLEVDLAVDHLRTMDQELPWIADGSPFGTVAAIFPYDAAVVMLARLGGGAVLTGNRLLFSFSSWTPETARLVIDICKPFAGLQSAVSRDNRGFGDSCVRDDAVRVLFISGSSAVGSAYRRQHGAFDKLFFAGPGGMPVALVFEDADPERASTFIARRAFINGGQYCTTLKKALIHEKHYAAVRQGILDRCNRLKVGDPFDPETDIGPIRVQRTRLILQNALDRCQNARILAGGIDDQWVYPLVLEAEQIPDLELFGPFLVLQPFADGEQAVSQVVKTRYGFLAAYFGTPPQGQDLRLREHFGMVHNNPDFLFTPLRLPFGGKKESGWILERQGSGWRERDGAFLYSKELVHDSK